MKFIRNLLVGFSVVSIIIAIGIVLLHSLLGWHSVIGRSVIAGLLALLLLWLILSYSDIKGPGKKALGRPKPQKPSPDEILSEEAAMVRNYGRDRVALFVDMVLDPPHYLHRINEYAAMEADAPRLQITIHQEYQVRHTHSRIASNAKWKLPEAVLVPVAWPERGTLLDHFGIIDAEGTKVSTLSYNQTRGLLAFTLRALMEMAETDRSYPRDISSSRDLCEKQKKKELLERLVVAICSPGPLHKQDEKDRKQLEGVLQDIDDLPITRDWRDRLRHFSRQHIDGYVIVAEVSPPSGNYLGLTYTHSIPLESPTTYRFNLWRERFGLSPATIDIVHSPFAFQVNAYHLEVSARPEQYVYDHHLERIDTRECIKQSDLQREGFKPYVRLYYEAGRPNAHLYIRPQGGKATRTPVGELSRIKSVIEYREIPPGALGGAAAVAWVSAGIITFFAVTRLGFAENSDSGTGPLPALLIAAPGFVTALMGSWIELSRLRRTSLTTFLALGGTMLASLISALYYLYVSARGVPTSLTLTPIFSVPDGHSGYHPQFNVDVGWLILTVFVVTHALFLLRQVICESRYYHACVRERVRRRL